MFYSNYTLQNYYDFIEKIMFSGYRKNNQNRYIIDGDKYQVIEDFLHKKVSNDFIALFVEAYGFDKAYDEFDYISYEEDGYVREKTLDLYNSLADNIIEAYIWDNKLYDDASFEIVN